MTDSATRDAVDRFNEAFNRHDVAAASAFNASGSGIVLPLLSAASAPSRPWTAKP